MAQTFLNLAQGVTGTLPTSNYVGGKVIQKVIVQDQAVSNDIVTTSSSFVTTGIEVTITPTSASNMIDVYFVSSMSTSQSSDEGNAMCYVNDANATWFGNQTPSSNFWQVAYKVDSGNKYAPIVWSGRYDPSNTNALNSTIYHRRESGSGNSGMRTVHSYSSYLFSAMEVEV